MSVHTSISISQTVHVLGIGLHSGSRCSVTIEPAELGAGISLILPGGTDIALRDVGVERTQRCTRINDGLGNSLDTPEHLLAAISILKLDDCVIRFEGLEVPILDGSSQPWIDEIVRQGKPYSARTRHHYRIVEEFVFHRGGSYFRALPGEQTLSVSIDFDNPHIGRQSLTCAHHDFLSLAGARTFVLEKEIAALKKAGLALGGSLTNAVVVGDDGVINPDGLRYKDEFVRHKALDLLGDLFLCGYPIIGAIEAVRPGHSVNADFLSALCNSGCLRFSRERTAIAA